MSIRFAIKTTAGKADKEGDVYIRYTGEAEPFNRLSERDCRKVGVDGGGNPKISFVTGLDKTKVKFYNWYNEEEQKSVLKQIEELSPLITDFYGADIMDDCNKYFWQENRDINRLMVTNETVNSFYDTKNPYHALLYLSIIGGAYMDMVAPTREWAERHQTFHYVALETDDVIEDEDEITRSDAHGLLSELRKDANPEALFILAWCIQYDTTAFGGINRATPLKALINTHIQYIDGKLISKKKRNAPKVFIDYGERWKGSQTRAALYAEAYIKAGEYFNYVHQNEKKYVTAEGSVLGNTMSEAIATIMKPKFRQDLENLRDKVEAKWKE